MSSSSTPERTYQAFISYRHADNTLEGRHWATWLHQAIETYQVPDELVGKKNSRGEEIPERIFPIFRDEDELPADADLGNSIANALKASRLLVVVCSPNAVASTYVADEIDYFKRLGHSDRIIAMIIDGEPNVSWDTSKHKLGFSAEQECFPEPLQFRYDEDGNRTEQRAEPIAADFRVFHDGQPQQAWTSQAAYRQQLKADGKLAPQDIDNLVKRYGEQQNLMLLKIIAGILGVPLGELTQRDKAYQLALAKQRAKRLRQWLAVVGVLALMAITAGIWAYMQQQVAEQQRDVALVSQSRFLLNQSQQQAQQGNYDDAILLGLNAMPGLYGGDRPLVDELSGVRIAMQQNNKLLSWRAPQAVKRVVFIPNSLYIAVGYENGLVDILNLETAQVVEQLNHEARISDISVSPQGQFIALQGRDSRLTIWSSASFEKINDIAMRGWADAVQFDAAENHVFALRYPGVIEKYRVNDPILIMETEQVESANRLIISDNDKYIATANLFGLDVHVFDAETGELRRVVATEEDLYAGVIRVPKFNPLNNDVIMVYSSLGTHSYALTSEESGFAEGYHMTIHSDGERALMLPTGRKIESGNKDADALNSLGNSPVVVNLNTKKYVPIAHGFGPKEVHLGTENTVYSVAGSEVFVWDEETGKKRFSFTAPNAEKIAFNMQQKQFLTWDVGSQQIELYNLTAPVVTTAIPAPYQASRNSLSPSGQWLLVLDQNKKKLAWLNTQTNALESEVTIPCKTYLRDPHIVYSSDETSAVVHCQRDLWFKLQRGDNKSLPISATSLASGVGGNHQQRAVEFADLEQGVYARVFDWKNNTTISEVKLPANSRYEIDELNISNDGNMLIVRAEDNKTWVYNLTSDRVELEVPVAGEAVWLPQPKVIVIRENNQLTFWRANQSEPFWRFANGRDYEALLPIKEGAEVLVQASSDELIWLDVATQQITQVTSFNGYLPSVREYSTEDLLVIIGYRWQAWWMSNKALVQQSAALENSMDVAFDINRREWVKVLDIEHYQRYPAWLSITVEQARQFLPLGKRCLTNEQRAQYYLPALTEQQKQQRGCI
ncbi:MAG: toll/interleukin-1 receptor domain-containing protein [Gammaproteobacteria bacterium]|nr:toll/interleukin-1 receptor domain-containing protein [Gammaproteobacteria bacterium]